MHRNPVKRGLLGSPEQWHWSSYRYYLLDEAGPVLVNLGWAKISFRNRAAWGLGSQNLILPTPPFPPLQKPQGRGTHFCRED
jgi:hypothetical protein